VDVNNLVGNRKDFAGYEGSEGINLRGKDLGELQVVIYKYWQSGDRYAARISTMRGNYPYDNLTKGEYNFVNENVVPELIAYIKANETALRDDCIDFLEGRFNSELDAYMAKGELLKKQAREVLNTLKSN
jgi:hypothetical protein